MLSYIVPWACFGVSFAVAAAALLSCHKQKKENQSRESLYRLIDQDENSAYLIIDSDSCVPTYISDGVYKLFGLDKDTVNSDIYSLEWCVSKDAARKFHSEFDNWDREEPFTGEFEFENIETKEPHFGRIYISDCCGELLVKIDDIEQEMKIRRRLKEELEQVKTEEQHKSDFLSKMSHEIRTPMNGILGMMTLAKKNINSPADVMVNLDKAHSLAEFMLSLINDILDMSKIESGKVVLEHERFDFIEIYDKISEMFRLSMEQKGVSFVMTREDMDIRYVEGDSLRLLQTLINFISNAGKYTPKGGTVSITFRQMNKADGKVHMLFKIKDNGKGMDPAFLNRIFIPFEQESASTTRKFGGTGLGMAIADNLVRLMGGHIVVDTALGLGSEFSVYIPFDIAPGDQSMENETEAQAQSEAASLEGLRILMAEDNAINAEIATELFAMENAELEIAENGKVAIEMFCSHPDGYYDLIFMDIQMPEMDGWTAAAEIRKLDSDYAKNVPIFALSANAFVEDKRHSVEIGMNGHISKPIDFDELKRAVAGYLK